MLILSYKCYYLLFMNFILLQYYDIITYIFYILYNYYYYI
jgi:hypothetical protein